MRMRTYKRWRGLLTSALALTLSTSACSGDDDGQEQPLLGVGEACTDDASCESTLCLSDLQHCAATCASTSECEGSDVCEDGFCVAADYCDEGFGPGCAPAECDPECGDNARCESLAEGGASCVCDTGFEGDGFTCLPEGSDLCESDNGGCGDPDESRCTVVTIEGAPAVECLPVNPCDEDNGGCGDPDTFFCTNPEPFVAACGRINPCDEDNGGCGDPAYNTCTNTAPGDVACEALDACESNNGGCGLEYDYACVPNPGAEPGCWFIGVCEESLVIDASMEAVIRAEEPDTPHDNVWTLVNPAGFSTDFNGSGLLIDAVGETHSLYSFDIDPGDYNLDDLWRVSLEQVTLLWDHDPGLPTTLETRRVSNAWTAGVDGANDVTWNTRPDELSDALSFSRIDPAGGGTQSLSDPSRKMADMLTPELAQGESRRVSLSSISNGPAVVFYSRGVSNPMLRPRLDLRFLTCDHIRPAPVASASVSRLEPAQTYTPGEGLLVDGDRNEAFLRFELQIPSGATITNARLELTTDEMSDEGQPSEFIVDTSTEDAWDEAAITWDTRPAAQNTELGRFTLDPARLAEAPETVGVETFELTEAVRESVAAGGLITLRIAAEGDASARFFDRSAASYQQPVLRVIYE
ncbi:DNRLRE domain-containing protein [Bradymonadales bacterium TMQ1]|nr:DNRLRE domain-containing protein [Bradymonadales bacterium TMQ1]